MKEIGKALVAAQSEMGKALKQSTNPHFKSKYADLSNVIDAVLPALNKAGIAVIQPPFDDETGRYVKTVLIHGESGETLECRVKLKIGKDDMQGYGSAVTYARRYGLMAMAGIAPEDDDGNAAAKAAPKNEPPKPISAEQYQAISDLIFDTETDDAQFCQFFCGRLMVFKRNIEDFMSQVRIENKVHHHLVQTPKCPGGLKDRGYRHPDNPILVTEIPNCLLCIFIELRPCRIRRFIPGQSFSVLQRMIHNLGIGSFPVLGAVFFAIPAYTPFVGIRFR